MAVWLVLLLAICAGLIVWIIGQVRRERELREQLSEQTEEMQEAQQNWEQQRTSLEQELKKAQKQEGVYYNTARDLFFARLTGGYYQDPDVLAADGKYADVVFPNPVFAVLVARLETWGDLFEDNQADRQNINFILRNVLQDSFSGVTYAADVCGRMVAILNLPEMPEGGMQALAQEAQQVLELLETEFGLTVTVAISRFCESPVALAKAYDEALRVFEFRQLLEEDYPVTTYEELTYTHVGLASTSWLELEQNLLRSIREANLPGLRLALQEMSAVGFGVPETSIDTIRFRVYGTVNILLCIADDLRNIIGNDVIDAVDPGPRLSSAESLGEIEAVISDILDALDQRIAGTGTASWVTELPGYVEENFRNPDLNVTSVADHFGLTPTYCSKLFKERYGQRLHDYIQSRRLEAARALLQTNRSISQAAEEAGFSNTLAMSRAFKKHEGSTPGQFRDKYQRTYSQDDTERNLANDE